MTRPITSFFQFFRGLSDTLLSGYVSASMFIYGALKFAQFGLKPYSDRLVSELSGMELMWAFYGHTLTYPLIIGGFEILGSFLFFFKRTRVLGGLLLTSILVNIIIQDIIYGVLSGAIVSASIYQLIIFYFFYKGREQIFAALKTIANIEAADKTIIQRIVHTALAVLMVLFIKMTIGL